MKMKKASGAIVHLLVAGSSLYSLVSLSINGAEEILKPASRVFAMLMILALIFSAMVASLRADCIREALPAVLQKHLNVQRLGVCLRTLLAAALFGMFLYCSLYMIGPFAPKGMPLTIFALIFATASVPLVWGSRLLPRTCRWDDLRGMAPACLACMIITLFLLYWSQKIWLAFSLYAILALGVAVARIRRVQNG